MSIEKKKNKSIFINYFFNVLQILINKSVQKSHNLYLPKLIMYQTIIRFHNQKKIKFYSKMYNIISKN